MNVLSLFNGMSCGEIALRQIGIIPSVYYSSEIDKYAIAKTQLNFPDTIQLGSVVNVNVCDLQPIDLLIGGSPCTNFSFAGKRKGMATKCEIEIYSLEKYLELKEQGFEFEGQSYLFWEYMRILRESKPKYFLLENVVMGEKWEKILSDAIGVKPIMINSALVSAQNRKRLYWIGQIRERLYYSENYCYLCGNLKNQQDENRGIQEEAQRKRTSKILGIAQIRCCNMQSVQKNILKNRSERYNKNLFGGMSNNQQEKQRQEQGCCIKSRIQQEVLQREQEGIIEVPTGLSKNWYRKRQYEKGRFKKSNSKERKVQSLQGIESTTEQKDFRNNKYFESKTDMCCVQCGKELDHRPRYSFVEGWDKYERKSPSSLSKMQFDEIKQNNGRIFDIIPIGVQGIDSLFGETINPIPQPKDRGILLKDILEKEVDEKYYLSDKISSENILAGFNGLNTEGKGRTLRTGGKSSTDDKHNFDLICVSMVGRKTDENGIRKDNDPNIKAVQRLEPNLSGKTNCLTSVQKDNLVLQLKNNSFESDNRFYSENGKHCALLADGIRKTGVLLVKEATEKGFIEVQPGECFDFENPKSTTRRGRKLDEKSNCLMAKETDFMQFTPQHRIRRLTPNECARLQTVPDWYEWECSDTQKYRMLGNGWTCEVISHILNFMK